MYALRVILYERTGRYEEAKKLYERFAEEAPEAASIDLLQARVAKREKPPKLVPDAVAGAAGCTCERKG